jgi:hypothetical protein
MRNSGIPSLCLFLNRQTETINSICENGFLMVDEFKFNAVIIPVEPLWKAMKYWRDSCSSWVSHFWKIVIIFRLTVKGKFVPMVN